MRRSACATAAAVAVGISANAGMANTIASDSDAMSSRMDSLLGSQREAIAPVPTVQRASQAVLPSPDQRGLVTRPEAVSYDAGFIASQPEAKGDSQWHCLTEALYFEARGESVKGLFAVGEVILNRVDSSSFPGTVCGVVNQGTGEKYQCQFTYTCDGAAETIAEPRAWGRVGKVARLLIDGAPRELTDGATYYHTEAVNPSWSSVFAETAAIGVHRFYRS